MRYFLFSAFVHLMVVIAGLTLIRDSFSFDMAGDPTVTFSMVGESSHASGSASDMVAAKPVAPAPQPERKKAEPVKEKAPEVTPEPEPEKIPEEVIEEPITEEVPEPVEEPEEIIEVETQPEEIITDDTDTIHEEEVSAETEQETDESTDTARDTSEASHSSQGETALGEGLVQLDDGSVAAKNQGVKGLSYGFLSQPEPNYPSIARRMGIKEEIVIKARFLIGYDGRVEEIKFYDHVENFGFREEVEKALRGWRATPIEVDGRRVKLYFYKAFKFERLS